MSEAKASTLSQIFRDKVRRSYLADLDQRIAAGVTPAWMRQVGEAVISQDRTMRLLELAVLTSQISSKPTSDRMSVGE